MLKEVDKKGDQTLVKAKQNLMKAYREKEANLDKTISSFLQTKYGSSGEPQTKLKQDELVAKVKNSKKKIADGRKEKKQTEEDAIGDEPILTKKEIHMSVQDMKYMS